MVERVEINDNHKLFIKLSPGAITYTKSENGEYEYRAGALGGSGGGSSNAKEIAKRLEKHDDHLGILALLNQLGWSDVVAELKRLLSAQPPKPTRLEVVEKEIQSLRYYYAEHKDHDYWWFRYKIYDDIVSTLSDPTDESDISVRRMHYAANAAIGQLRKYEELLLEREVLVGH